MAKMVIGAQRQMAPEIPDDEILTLDDEDSTDALATPAQPPAEKQSPLVPRTDRLDRSRSYGTVYSVGPNKTRARFYQAGRHYDSQGNRIMIPGDEEREAAEVAERLRTAAERAERLRGRAAAVERGEPDPEDLSDPDAVNLTLWGEGKVEYLFSHVRRAIEARYHRSLHNVGDAVDFLVDEKVVARARARKLRQPVRQT